jgi:hypothetical protein
MMRKKEPARGGFRTLVLILAAGAGGCSTPPPLPTESELIRDAFAKPNLDWCDALACYYHPITFFGIRNARCVPAEPSQGRTGAIVDCSYERRKLPGHWLLAVDGLGMDDEPAPKRPPAAPWKKARTIFEIYDSKHWFIVQDETNWE